MKTEKGNHIEIGIPASLTAKTGMAVMTAENLIRCYEGEGQKILKAHGCPTTLNKLIKQRGKYLPDLGTAKAKGIVYSVFWMLWNLEHVRSCLKKNDADQAVCYMTTALSWASMMQMQPILPLIDRGKAHSDGSSLGGQTKKKLDTARHDKWLSDAAAISKDHPSYAPWRIAGILHERYKGRKNLYATQQTIWRIIK